ncbi:MAG: hypothetical protein NWE99_10885 [Candidatus Bathyarchaeota archaeon]|nr:hypothetical protein [Candidatus Bathyarchaeota archaeon]
MSSAVKRLREVLRVLPVFGASASPQRQVVYDVAEVKLKDCWELYKRDPACRSSVDLLAASAVGAGFYTTCAVGQEKAKETVDAWCKRVNLDRLLQRMAKRVIACGNDFWLKVDGEVVQLPLDAIEKIEIEVYEKDGVKVPRRVSGYKLSGAYGGGTLRPDVVIHWRLEDDVPFGFGIGLLQTLLYTLSVGGDRRPAFAWMKAKIERIMPKIFEKYAGPDVLAILENASKAVTDEFKQTIRNRPEEGAWLFYAGKGAKGSVTPVTIDPRARFEYYIDHIVNQFYLGCETPLPRLFSTPGFTEASARTALDLQDMLVKPVQRDFKRTVEGELFDWVLAGAGVDFVQAAVRLNWGSPETPAVVMADLIAAAEQGFIRPEEFRKNAVKFGWELWDAPATQQQAAERKAKVRWLVEEY